MSWLRSLSIRKKIAVTVAAALLCIALPLCMSASVRGGGSSYGDGNRVTAPVLQATPFRTYTALDANFAIEGYEAYRGMTTVKGLKKNLIVRGTTNANGLFTDADTYVLTHDEYDILKEDTLLSDTAMIADPDLADTSVALVVASGNATGNIVVKLSEAEAPAVSSLTLTVPSNITDDHTADTILDVLSVQDQDGNPLGRDLYTVELGNVVLGQRATVTVVSVTNPSATDTKTVSVVAAKLAGVDVRVDPSLTLDGLYYKKDGGLDAFIKGATPQEVFEQLVVTAIYPNSRKTLELTFNDTQHQLSGTRSGEGISTDFVNASSDAARTFWVKLTDRTQENVNFTTTLTINFADVSIIDIAVNQAAFDAKIAEIQPTSYTTLRPTDFMVADTAEPIFQLKRSDGSTVPVNTNNNITLETNLTPTAADITAYANASAADKKSFTYSRDITVNSAQNPAVSISVTVKSIAFKNPTSVINIGGTAVNQMMHHDFTADGLTVVFGYADEYGDTTMVSAPLKDFDGSSFLTTTIKNNKGVNESKISVNTDSVVLEFTYNDGTASFSKVTRTLRKANSTLVVVKDRIAAPDLDCSALTYSENKCYKEFTYDAEKMDIAFYYGDAETSAANYANGRINFLAGGTYRVRVSLKNTPSIIDEYAFYSDKVQAGVIVGESSVDYTIVINKGTLAVNLQEIAGNIFYGDAVKPVVTGTVGGRTYTLIQSGTAQDKQLVVPYKLVFCKAGETYDPDDYDYNTYIEPAKLDAGAYTVYAITKDTDAYLASKTRAGQGISIEIQKKTLTFSAVQTYVYERGVHRTVDNFITANGTFAYDDTAAKVLSVTESGTPVTSYTHVGKHAVTIAIVAAYQKNYVLDGDVTSVPADFEITQRKLTFTATAGNFVYGAAGGPALNIVKNDVSHFYALLDVSDVVYYHADASGNKTTLVDNADFDTWAVGKYVAYFKAKADTAYPDELQDGVPVDYDLPDFEAVFEVTPAQVAKVAIGESGWTTETPGGWVGQYGATYTATLGHWLTGEGINLAASGRVTVTVGGMRLEPHETVAIDGDKILLDDTTGILSLTEAGSYTVTIRLNANYVWSDSTTDDIVYYGKIYKQYITGLALSADTTYTGEVQTQTVKATIGSAANHWTNDALQIVSVTGTSQAALTGGALAEEKISQENGTFDVTYAGAYDVVIGLADPYNYEFNDGDTSTAAARVANRTETYTVAQAAFKVTWDYDDSNPYPFDEGATAGQKTPDYTIAVDFAADIDNLRVAATTLYHDNNNAVGDAVSGNKITASGKYWIRVTAIGGTAADNYCLTDTQYIQVQFRIEAQGLLIPTLVDESGMDIDGDTVTVTYNGQARNFSAFLKNLSAYIEGDIHRILITVDAMDGDNPDITDVKRNGGIVEAYTVTITPNTSYSWKDGTDTAQTYYILVNPLQVQLNWTDPTDAGSAAVYTPGKTWTPTVTIANLQNADDKKDGAVVLAALTGAENAGVHAVELADSLTGDRAGNYTFDAVGSLPAVDRTHQFTIIKRAVVKPTATTSGHSFSGETQRIQYGHDAEAWANAAWYTANVTVASTGANNFPGVAADKKTIASGTYGFNTDYQFYFLHAGDYTVTFALKDQDNYCWANTADQDGVKAQEDWSKQNAAAYTRTDSFTVQRMTLTAPALKTDEKDQRAIERVEGQFLSPTLDGYVANSLSAGKTHTVYYSLVNGWYNPADGMYTDYTEATKPTETDRHTVYYVKLTIDASHDGTIYNPYDYVWADNSTDKAAAASNSYLTALNGVYGEARYDADGVSMYLCYVITKTQIDDEFAFTFRDYTFGENGVKSGTSETHFLGSDLTLGNMTTADKGGMIAFVSGQDNLEPEDAPNRPFADAKVTVTFYRNAAAEGQEPNWVAVAPDASNYIVNGMPWNAGNYRAFIAVTFDDGADYNDFGYYAPFTVEQLEIAVTYDDEDKDNKTVTYNGAGQMRTATIANLPDRKTAGDTTADLNVQMVDGMNRADTVTDVRYVSHAVSAYDVCVTGIQDGVNKNNFKLPADYLTVFRKQLTVQPEELTVTTAATTHVYGDTLDTYKSNADGAKYYTVTVGTIYGSDQPIVIYVRTSTAATDDGNKVDNLAAKAGGTYYLVPQLVQAEGNYTLTVEADGYGQLNVIKRQLTIDIADNAGSTYGDTIDLTDSGLYTVTAQNGDNLAAGQGIPSGAQASDVFTLSLTKQNGDAVTDLSYLAADTYTVALTENDSDNYTIAFADDQTYTVAKAEIFGIDVAGYGQTAAEKYDALYHGLLAKKDASTHKPTGSDINAPVWKIAPVNSASDPAPDASAYHTYAPDATTHADTVHDAGSYYYYVYVTADNHKDTTPQLVTVQVAKVELTVSVDLSIYFGEDGPDARGTDGQWYQQSLSDLRKARADGSAYTPGGSIFTVTGLLNGSASGGTDDLALFANGDFYSLTEGVTPFSYGYAGTAYAKGSDATTYPLTFQVGGLSCGNYTFTAGASVLTVKALPISVTIHNQTAVYNQPDPDALATPSLTTTQTSGYGGTAPIEIYHKNIEDIVTVATAALSSATGYTTNAVGTYDITPTEKNANYVYTFVYDNDGVKATYTITAATLQDLATVTGYTADYDAGTHSALILDGQEVTADTIAALATTVDGTAITVVFSLTAVNDWTAVTDTKIPTYKNVVTQTVYYCIKADNHVYATGQVTVTIRKTTNATTNDGGYTLFVNASADSAAVPTTAAWTYGYYSVAHTAGYDPNGDQATVEPSMKFSDGQKIVYSLYSGAETTADHTSDVSMADLFAQAQAAGAFNAGSYRVRIRMNGTGNYDDFEQDWYFAVDKQTLTVTPTAGTVTYGDALTADSFGTDGMLYPYTYDGLVSKAQNGTADALDTVVQFAFSSDYAPGFTNGSVKTGGYAIQVSEITGFSGSIAYNDQGEFIYNGAQNYTVYFKQSAVTVTPRAIEITILDQKNNFNLLEDSTYAEQDPADLTFMLTNGRFVDGDGVATVGLAAKFDVQSVFVLHTVALTSPAGKDYKTNEQGTYPIYATAGAHFGTDGANYAITFSGSWTGTVTGALDGSQAGTFTIERLKLNMGILGPYKDEECTDEYTGDDIWVYDANPRYFKEIMRSLPAGVSVQVDAYYYAGKYDNLTEASVALPDVPQDAGSYCVVFKTNDENYVPADSFYDYTITRRSITVSQPSVAHESGSVTLGTNGYIFDGKDFLVTQSYSNILTEKGHALALASVLSGRYLGAGFDTALWAGSMDNPTGAVENNAFKFSVRNSGTYTFTLTLSDDTGSGFKAANYRFADNGTNHVSANGNSIECSVTILRAQLTIGVQETYIEYGSEIKGIVKDDRFGGYTPIWTVYVGTNALNATDGNALLAAEGNTNNFLRLKDGKTSLDYKAHYENGTAYAPGTSHWGDKVYSTFDTDSIVAYNFTFRTVDGDIKIKNRAVTVQVYGQGENGNTHAWTYYTGRDKNHNPELQENLNAHRASFLAADYGDNWKQPADFSTAPVLNSVSLRISETAAYNAGAYGMAPRSEAVKYAVTFKHGTDTITNVLDDPNLPKFEIRKVDLTISVFRTGTTSGNFTIPYGTKVSFSPTAAGSTFVIRYSGWVDGEGDEYGNTNANGTIIVISECTVLLKSANGLHTDVGAYAYEQWGSQAGEVFTVSPVLTNEQGTQLSFDNYNIVTAPATMTVDALTVSATANPVTYAEKKNADGSIDYKGGLSGIPHEVSLTFTYGDNQPFVNEKGEPLFGFADIKYNASYSTNLNNADVAGHAPTKVGDNYTATVTFTPNRVGSNNNYYNYKFSTTEAGVTAGGLTNVFTHKVVKQEITLTWDQSSQEFSEDQTDEQRATNFVRNYRPALMRIDAFTRDGVEVTDDKYFVSDKTTETLTAGLSMKLFAVGTYSLTVSFNADADKNYAWKGIGDKTKTLSFVVTVLGGSVQIVDFKLGEDSEDWAYDEPSKEPTAKLSNGVEGIITFSYASVDVALFTEDELLARLITDTSKVANLDYHSTYTGDAGWYIVKASYAGGSVIVDGEVKEYPATDAYRLFRIKQAVVDLPALTLVTSGDKQNTVYSGKELSATVTYNTRVVYVSAFGENYATTNTGSVLHATNAGNYEITFALRTPSNYVWDPALETAEGVTVTKNVAGVITSVTIVWKVAQAKDNRIIWDESDITVTYGETYTCTAGATYTNSVTIWYAEKGDTTDYTQATGWTTTPETAAGSYWIKAVCNENRNYNGAEDYKTLTINRKTLTATVNGTLTYGQSFDEMQLTISYAGFVSGDAGATIERDDSKLKPTLADTMLNGEPINKDQLAVAAGGYALNLPVEDGHIAGLTSRNYTIVASGSSRLIVQPKRIAVVIGTNSSSNYSEAIVLDPTELVQLNVEDLARWDRAAGVAVLDAVLTVNANENSGVGLYPVTGIARNANYDVTFEPGSHQITPLKIRVEITIEDGVYGGLVDVVKEVKIFKAESSEVIPADTFATSILYTGTKNNGERYNDYKCPQVAGRYAATVYGVSDRNYELVVSGTSESFEVKKKEIDASTIIVAPIEYTGNAVTEDMIELTDNDYNVGGKTIYTWELVGSPVAVGTHTVRLTMCDFDNMKWKSVDVIERDLSFEIVKARNNVIPDSLTIQGWTYGQYDATRNAPSATVKFGQSNIQYWYASSENGTYELGAPRNDNAGTYWVRVTVPSGDNYEGITLEESPAVSFTIAQVALNAPTLVLVTEGEGKNDTYTGSDLRAVITGYNTATMGISYDGRVSVVGNDVSVYALNTGDYTVTILLVDPTNYRWADGTVCNAEGAQLNWSIARKKIDKPTHNLQTYIVNGKILEYFPNGFDGAIMAIAGNKSGYGGTFTATVTLTDTANYEWADGSTDPISFTWHVVGANTVFAVVIGCLSGASGVAAAVAVVQLLRYRKRKRGEDEGPTGGKDYKTEEGHAA